MVLQPSVGPLTTDWFAGSVLLSPLLVQPACLNLSGPGWKSFVFAGVGLRGRFCSGGSEL